MKSFAASAEDAALFFGRDLERELIVANLLASRLTLLYGPSGVGKSSILCAGVVHQLRQAAPSAVAAPRCAVVYVEDWHGDPREAILRGVEQEAGRLAEQEQVSVASGASLQRLGGGPEPIGSDVSLGGALSQWSRRLDALLLIVLDQFEQYFLHNPPGRARRFDGELAAAIAAPNLRLRCLISLREDALVELDRFKGDIPGLFDNRLRLEGLTEEGALEAIRRPVERGNEQLAAPGQALMELEPGLAEEVVRQLRRKGSSLARGLGAPVALGEAVAEDEAAEDERIEPAHLQLVMEALWTREMAAGSHRLSRSTLMAMGGWAEIVRSHVNDGLDGLPAKQRAVAARAIRYLVTPSGIKVAHSPSDLASYTDAPTARIGETLERLSALRILRPLAPSEGSSERRYEVFHDLLANPLLDWRTRFDAQRLAMRVRWLIASLIAATTATLAIGAFSIDPAPLKRFELSTIDARFAIRGAVPPDKDIAIVDIDDRSLRALKRPRTDLKLRPDQAKLIELLLRGRPKVIAYDIAFSQRGDESQLLTAIERGAGKIVLVGEVFDREETDSPFYYLFEALWSPKQLEEEQHVRAAYGGLPLDPGDIFRRVASTAPRSELPSFSVAAAEVAAGHRLPKFTGSVLIDYHGPPRTFPTVSMIDVLRGRVSPSFFAGKIVLVGSSAKISGDIHRTSVTSGLTMSGTEIQANAISTVRHGPSLKEAGAEATVLLIVAFSLVSLLVVPLAWWAALACFAALAGVYLLVVQLLFDAGLVLPIVYPLLALALAATATSVAKVFVARRARGRRALLHAGAPPTAGSPGGRARSTPDAESTPDPETVSAA